MLEQPSSFSAQARFATFTAFAGVFVSLGVACGGAATKTANPTDATRTSDAGAPSASASVLPKDLPPMAKMPPPGVAGSKKAVVTHDPAFFSCAHTVRGNPKTVAERVVGAGQECAAVNPKTHALGSPFEGRQADKDPAQSQKIHVEAKCYRVYFAHDPSIKDASLVLLDSAGDVVATSADTALPEDGQACFSAPDDVTLVFGVGTGEGRYATQVWGE